VLPPSDLHVLRVFTGSDGTGGNPLAVFLDGSGVPLGERQAVAARLAFSETVFVDDAVRGEVRIFTPRVELPLAGHPLVGTAWLLAREREPVAVLRPPAGDVPTWEEQGTTWIRADPAWAPSFELRQLASPEAVDRLPTPPPGARLLDAWAWLDEAAGRVRSRVFPPALGIDEDEATGSAALRLGAALGRPIAIRQGRGSEILARPGPGGTVEIGGRVALVEARPHPLRG
jgi:predicted PhzF superfamily epimerase YddE/YHI9